MKKMNSVYFFFFLLGLIIMLGVVFMMVLESSQYIFLAVIAFAVIAVLMKTAINLSNGTLEQRTRVFKECSRCNKEIDVKSDYCRYCGAKQVSSVTCEYCGKENKEEDTICKHCNALLK